MSVGLVAAFTALACVAAGPAVAKKSKTFDETVSVGAPILNVPAVGKSTPVRADITVPKKYKKKIVGDVNVTFQTLGSNDGAASDLNFKLTAPSGRTVYVATNGFNLNGGLAGTNIGPLTLDDESPVSICNSVTLNCEDPGATLIAPFAGTANLLGQGTFNTGPLKSFDGLKMRGTWTLTVWDNVDPTTSLLSSWGLKIKPAKPVTE